MLGPIRPDPVTSASIVGVWEAVSQEDPRLFIFRLEAPNPTVMEILPGAGLQVLYKVTSIRASGGRFRVEGENKAFASRLVAEGKGSTRLAQEFCPPECTRLRGRARGTIEVTSDGTRWKLRHEVDFAMEPEGYVPALMRLYSQGVAPQNLKP